MAPASKKLTISSSTDSSCLQQSNHRLSEKRLLHSDSMTSYQVDNNNMIQYNPYMRGNENMKEILSQTVSYLSQDEIEETSTSRSIVHGLILVAIMITSLVAFVCSKVRKCSHYINLNDYEHCSKYFLFYSSMTMISCLATFIIYFLHLISQCNLLCLRKKKYEFEIMFISIVSCLLVLSSVCYMSHTNIFAESFTLVSFASTLISNVLYWLRIILLLCEMVSKKKRSKKGRALLKRSVNLENSIHSIYPNHHPLSSPVNMDNQSTQRPVVSYVRNLQRSKTLSTSVSDDFDDEVFIQ